MLLQTDDLVLIDGVAWVNGCKHNTPQGRAARLETAELAAAFLAGVVHERGCVVQGGGWIGLWPRALAKYFQTVITREPEATNYTALTQNLRGIANIDAQRAAYGATAHTTGLWRPQNASGMWRCDGPGEIPVIPIDGLGLEHVDAIVLDVERMELSALRGAEATIRRDQPVIWLEYHHDQAAIASWVRARGYSGPFPALKADVMFLPVTE